jgi:hypothetical protein
VFTGGAPAGTQGIVTLDAPSGLPNSTTTLAARITGVGVGRVVGIDVRPSTGQLYALGYDASAAAANAQLYTLDPISGVAVAVGSPVTLLLGGAPERIGFDFNPVADLIRVVSSNDANYRLNPTTGVVAGTDNALAYPATDLANAGKNPRVGAVAYTNSFRGSTSTELFAADVQPDASAPSGILSIITTPNSGVLNAVPGPGIRLGDPNNPSLSFGIDPEAIVNIDIYADGTTTRGYLVELTKPNGSGFSSTNLYNLTLTGPNAGLATNRRTVVPASAGLLFPFNITAIAVAPEPAIISLAPASATVGDPGFTLTVNGTGFINGTVVRFNGQVRPTTFVSATQVTAAIPASDVSVVGLFDVTVSNPPAPGVPSAPATFQVLPVCAAPTALSASAVTSTSATVSFTGSASATGYTVTTAPATTTQTLPASATSVSFTGLAPGTAYTVSIVSNCAANSTSATASTSFTTTAAPNPAPTLAVTQGGTSYPNNGTAYSFGSQTVGTTSPAVAFTLTNAGPDPLTINSISTTGEYAVSGPAPTTVAAGGTATVSVTFTPTAAGTRAGTLVINSNATNAATYTVNLGGTGVAATANPLIAVSQGGSAIGNGATFAGFASTTQGSTSAPVTFTITNGSATDNLTLGTFALAGPFALSGAQPTTVAAGSSATFSLTFTPTAVGANAGTLTIPNNSQANNPYVINLSGQGTSSALPDLVVSTMQTITGSYNNVTVTGTGVATLGGPLSVAGTFRVQPGGALVQNCQPLNGPGSFVLEAGASLTICDPAGLASSGAVGAVQVTGSRSFSPAASYAYNGTAAQVTGAGLPSQVLNLGVLNAAGLTLSQAVSVTQVVRLQRGNLTTAGNGFTLLSSAAGTALVDNTGGAVVGTATVQRYIDAGPNSGLGYRHYSSPVANSTVADLAAPGFSPVVNPAYNTVGNTVTPFPNVYGYDESRVTTSGNPGSQDFDLGFYSPNTTGDALEVTRGYTVNISGQATVDFVGTLNNGTLPLTGLSRGGQAQSGWQLRGNPYPSPLDWASLVNNGRATNLENALYVFKSSGQYSGTYTSYVNGQSTNSGTSVLPLGQGFLVRTVAGQTGSITFSNADRVTTPNTTPFQRGTTDTRPQLTLALGNATARTQAVVYFEQGATAGFDRAFDAHALPAPNGLTLTSESAAAEPLAINGQAALSGADVLVPLRIASRTAAPTR